MAAKRLDREASFSLIQPGGSRRFRESVAQQLAVQILSGKLPEGHGFPGEVEYAAQIGISRSALREAFPAFLRRRRLVEGRPKAGTRVTPRRQWSLLDPDLLAWQFRAEPSLKFLRDLFELRMIVEPGAAALAAARRGDDQVRQMGEALERMAQHGSRSHRGGPSGRPAVPYDHAGGHSE